MNAFKKIYSFLIILLLVGAGSALERVGFNDYFFDPSNWGRISHLLGRHLQLVTVSMTLATVTGVSIGIIFTRQTFRPAAGVVMYIVGLGQTVPSLAVLALIIGYLGVGFNSAVFALFVYSVLPIARNTLAGITSVEPSMLDAARGMGMTPLQILLQVEIPNAMRVILTGFRISLIINIGTAALAGLIGAGGMGELILTGINMMQKYKLLAGALPVIFMALFADFLCGLLQNVLIPRGLRLTEES